MKHYDVVRVLMLTDLLAIFGTTRGCPLVSPLDPRLLSIKRFAIQTATRSHKLVNALWAPQSKGRTIIQQHCDWYTGR